MNRLKVMTILGTRPEIIRLSETIKACDRYFDHILVHTGQNYDPRLNDIFFQELELRQPDYYLECVGTNLGETMGNILAKSYEVIQKEKEIAAAADPKLANKPAEMLDKILAGKINRFFSEICLENQPWVKDDKSCLKKLKPAVKVKRFVRWAIGEEL